MRLTREQFVEKMTKDKAKQKAKKEAQRIQAEADIRAMMVAKDKRISRR